MTTPIKLPFEASDDGCFHISPRTENSMLTLTPVKIFREKAKRSPFQTSYGMDVTFNHTASYSVENSDYKQDHQISNNNNNDNHLTHETDTDGGSTRHCSDNSNKSDNSNGSTIVARPVPTIIPQSYVSHQNIDNNKYNKNSIRFTKELENLIQDLNTIYNDIGYSSKEILQKETIVFSQLSDTIHSFSTKAQSEKSTIARENEAILRSLRLILKRIGDPRGTSTIQDLYSRNMIILSQQELSPSKREMSLLNKRKVLLQGSKYIFNRFQNILQKYVQLCAEYNDTCKLLDISKEYMSQSSFFILSIEECQNLQVLLSDQDTLSQSFYQNFNTKDSIEENILKHADLSEKGLYLMKNKINDLQLQYKDRFQQLSEITGQLKRLIAYLNLQVPTDLYTLIDDKDLFKNEELIVQYLSMDHNSTEHDSHMVISSTMISLLLRMLEALDILKSDREIERNALHEQCVQLWSKLKISQIEISKFMEFRVSQYGNSLSMDVISNYRGEIQRLVELRKQSISHLIQENWTKINDLWDKMGYPSEDRQEFTDYYGLNCIPKSQNSDENSDNDEMLLTRCEKEVSVLEEKYKLYEPLLKLIDVFESYMEDKAELEKSSRDSSRLISRNSHKILLKEEKVRKKIARNFPTIVKNLISKLLNFEQQFHRHFCDKSGEPVIHRAQEQEDELSSRHPRSRIQNGNISSSPLKAHKVEKPAHANNSLDKDNKKTKLKSGKLLDSLAVTKRTISGSSSHSDSSSVPKQSIVRSEKYTQRKPGIQSPTQSSNNKLSLTASNKLNSPSQRSSKIPNIHCFQQSPVLSKLPATTESSVRIHQRQSPSLRSNSPSKLPTLSQPTIRPQYSNDESSVSGTPNAEYQESASFDSNSKLNGTPSLDADTAAHYHDENAPRNELESHDNYGDDDYDPDADDSNFSVWKNEQLVKISNHETMDLD